MTNADKDFRNAEIMPLGNGFEIVDYPAVSYIHSTDPEQPVCADKGGVHLGKREGGISVAFPTRTHGLIHKSFGLGVYGKDDNWGNKAGEVYAYSKCVSITAERTPKEFLAAAHLGDVVLFNGQRYVIERRSNDNIALVPA